MMGSIVIEWLIQLYNNVHSVISVLRSIHMYSLGKEHTYKGMTQHNSVYNVMYVWSGFAVTIVFFAMANNVWLIDECMCIDMIYHGLAWSTCIDWLRFVDWFDGLAGSVIEWLGTMIGFKIVV